jgi:hypothetical protein
MKTLMEAHATFVKSLRASGAYRDSERLRPSSEGKRVRVTGGTPQVQDGPFAETKEALGGYYLFSAASLEEALDVARRCPVAPGTIIDIRPVMKGSCQPAKRDQPGKVFFFGVLGHAPSEAAWSELMDRIDAETQSGFPHDAFLGGVRLDAPTPGKRLAAGTLQDGPFIESKEVIGGLAFLRLPSMADAVRWASGSKFMPHGTLEIRELW